MALFDDFNRPNSGSIGTPSDGGPAWEIFVGSWGIFANAAYNVDAANHAACVRESGASDGRLLVTIGATASVGLEVIFRVSDYDNLLLVQYFSGNWFMFRKEAENYTQIGVSPTMGTPSVGQVMDVILDGDQLTFHLDDFLAIGPITETFNQSATKHGLAGNSSSAMSYDEFSFTELTTLFRRNRFLRAGSRGIG